MVFERAQAEDRDVEAEILPGLHGLHEEGFVGLEGAGAAEHVVGALEGLDGEDGALADDTALTDVEPGHFTGDGDAVLHVFIVYAEPASHGAKGGELVVDEGAGVEQGDAELLDLAGDRAKDGLGIAALEGKEDGGWP
jgi:hypothetical protein